MLEDVIGQLEIAYLAKDDPSQVIKLLSVPNQDDKPYEFGRLGLLMHSRLPLCPAHERDLQQTMQGLRR